MIIELIFEFEPDFEKSKSGSPAAAARKPMVQVGSKQLQRQTRHRLTTCSVQVAQTEYSLIACVPVSMQWWWRSWNMNWLIPLGGVRATCESVAADEQNILPLHLHSDKRQNWLPMVLHMTFSMENVGTLSDSWLVTMSIIPFIY